MIEASNQTLELNSILLALRLAPWPDAYTRNLKATVIEGWVGFLYPRTVNRVKTGQSMSKLSDVITPGVGGKRPEKREPVHLATRQPRKHAVKEERVQSSSDAQDHLKERFQKWKEDCLWQPSWHAGAPKRSSDSLRLRRRFFPWSPQHRAIYLGPKMLDFLAIQNR